MKYILFFIIPVYFISCSTESFKKELQNSFNSDTIKTFTDSISIGKKGFNKVTLQTISENNKLKTLSKFYSRKKNSWYLEYSFLDPENNFIFENPKIVDFNNDGYNDFTYTYAKNKLSGDEFKYLFIFQGNNTISYVEQSYKYPNFYFDKNTNLLSTRSSLDNRTIFMKLSGNILLPIAVVEQQKDRIAVSIYEKDKEKIIYIDSINTYRKYTRFKNYTPLEVY
ncbi:hypothetical protein ACM39_16870 [Chryseobacterium sp. FH2]|uniref:hypothetical protein n=1 Tax=Chryseobacterium sp. FH2 TaxID=1674291 RepID=UPI00065AC5D3|nr:hypothetical protein [Chryseobacterium sp. FH2]KMQ64197.1 hypothetical protein ACM39_16870 [Chryseobacterium sp. FH2]